MFFAVQLAPSMGIVVAVYKISEISNVLAESKFFSEGNISLKIIASLIIISGTVLLLI